MSSVKPLRSFVRCVGFPCSMSHVLAVLFAGLVGFCVRQAGLLVGRLLVCLNVDRFQGVCR